MTTSHCHASNNKSISVDNKNENEKNETQNNLNIVREYLPEEPKIIQNLKSIDYPDSGVEIEDYTTHDLINRFQEITSLNLESEDSSMLCVKRFNVNLKEIQITDNREYFLLKDFLEEGNIPELNHETETIFESEFGKIVMEGYRRYLKNNRFITVNFHQVFELCHRNKDTWYYIDEIHKKIMVCFQDLSNQYLESVDERYKYLGCLLIVYDDKKQTYRIPIYLDKNSEISIPTVRQIKKKFFTMYNISMDKDIYVDFDIDQEKLHLIIDESKELVRYKITHNGILIHNSFPSYLNTDYLEEINVEENKHILTE